LAKLPAGDAAKRERINRGLTRSLGQYGAIAVSTGMPLGEVIGAALSKAEGKTHPGLGKTVSSELDLDKVFEEAGKENYQKKEEAIAAGETAAAEIVIGGVGGTGLDEAGFDRRTLQESYGYGEAEAKEAERFLHGIRAYDEGLGESLAPALAAIVAGHAGKNIAGLKESLLSTLEARPGTQYNLAGNTGLGAYMARGGSGLNRARIQELVRERTGSAGSAVSIPGIRRIEPAYRSVPGIVPLTRSSPRGTPEKVYRQVYNGGAFSGGAAGISENAMNISRGGRAGNTNPQPVAFTRGQAGSGGGATPVSLSAAMLPGGGKPPVAIEPVSPGVTPEIRALGEERRRSRDAHKDAELERLRKINANYEKDKAKLAREKAPALARSASHDIGHAEGSGEIHDRERTKKQMSKKLQVEFEKKLMDTIG
jgi:hypothetical protein